ncbi:MAG: site-2 protease family protein [Parcubacteria group bacterium]|nr:site-2 protease family protein [Parcubacteria group bacterium]
MSDIYPIAFQLIVLLFSVVIHEVSHGVAAYRLGDPTAKLMGRLTLNPIKHLDFFGSLIMPFSVFLLTGGRFVFGWAKPVPYNPANLKNPRLGSALVALAGPLSNFSLAVIFGLISRLLAGFGAGGADFAAAASALVGYVVLINLLLAVFNLVPIPPLDGSRVLFYFLPQSARAVEEFLERYGFVILMLFIFFGFRLIAPVVYLLYDLLV